MRRRQMMQKVSRISLCVVIGLLFLALIWKFAGAQLAKKGIVLSNDTAAKTVSETAPEAEDGSGNAGIKKLAETTPPNETPGWQYSSSGWWYATDATTYYVNGWADIDGNQYHFDSNGYMATGWKAIGGKGCYFDDQGVYQPDRNGSMMVALTFDDGPGVYTSTLLDTLEQYGAQATFFMLGSNVEKYGADVIPRMAAIGCELGNHSYAHPNMKELSLDDGFAQFQMTDDLIAQYNNGQGATVIRFPYGNSTDELLASIGRPSIMWDVDTLDWQTKNVQATISAVLDWKQGGQMYSRTTGLSDYYGVSKRTENREGTIIFDGYKQDGTKNDIAITGANAQQVYYSRLNDIDESSVYDNSFIKLREVAVSYKVLQKKWMELSVNAFARNILVWAQMPDLDPEASQGNNNMSGAFEDYSMPQTASFGFGFNIKF